MRIIDLCFIYTHFFLLRVISSGWILSQHGVGGRQENTRLIANPPQGQHTRVKHMHTPM